jgi:hypothetical protein
VIEDMCIAANSVRKRVGVKNAGYIAVAIGKVHWAKRIIETGRGHVADV